MNPNGYIDSIGVYPSYQGRGLASALYRDIFNTAASADSPRFHTIVSSNNVSSLRLHRAMGFKEKARRAVWERRLLDRQNY